MAVDYVEKVAKVVSILGAFNTTTASPDLSASMTSRVANIYNDDPNIRGLRVDQGPALYVSINRGSQEETQIGDFANRRKEITISYDIHGALKREGFSTTHETTLTDFYQMASNLEAVLKQVLKETISLFFSEITRNSFITPK